VPGNLLGFGHQRIIDIYIGAHHSAPLFNVYEWSLQYT
jgi:hypothetical protein